jgi:hypothetical protein
VKICCVPSARVAVHLRVNSVISVVVRLNGDPLYATPVQSVKHSVDNDPPDMGLLIG